jgi:Zn-finger nucleic acid-binding protein
VICPTCHNVMIVIEHEHIELDYCTECSGAWFDSGELELMLEVIGLEDRSLALGDIFASPEAETTEKKRRCPICRRKMKKTIIGDKPEVLIDRCPKGDGLWFDGGEVRRLITQWVQKPPAKLDSQQRILTFLGETFKIDPGSD